MPYIADFLTPADLQKISNLQVVARTVVEGFVSGLHKSPHKGFSIEFAQHRPYVQGDEIRRLDWKVYGKTDRYYVREYEEETNLRATILLDLSGSMAYGSANVSKAEYAVRLSAALAYLMIRQADSVGLATFDSKIRRYIPPRSSVSHLKVLLGELSKSRTDKETRLGDVFRKLVPRMHRRGLLIILSDCFDDVKSLNSALTQFRAAHHEVLVFQIVDRDELDFPFKEWTHFECLEKEGYTRTVEPAAFRSAYLKKLKEFQKELTENCHRNRIELCQIVTDEPYAEALARFLTKRLSLM